MKTIKITTPIGSLPVEIREWITGREAEYIDELMYEAVAVKANMSGTADISNIDLKKMVTETNHRKIEKFVVSVGGKPMEGLPVEDRLSAVLDLHENNTAFILEAIDNQRKKK